MLKLFAHRCRYNFLYKMNLLDSAAVDYQLGNMLLLLLTYFYICRYNHFQDYKLHI